MWWGPTVAGRLVRTAVMSAAFALASSVPATAQLPRQAGVLGESAAANCRLLAPALESRCATPLSPAVSRAQVDAYAGSWVNRALGLQEALGRDVGLRNAPFIGTHNSFNSVAEMGVALSPNDSNQQLTLTDQLRLDVRSLELDVHKFPRVQDAGFAAVVCHGAELHAGCSTEKPLGAVLDEISAWLTGHRDQVLLLYLEDHLDDAAGYAAGAEQVRSRLGDALYRPPAGGARCEPLPLDLSRQDVLDAGRQVIVMSGCGVGPAWPAVAFSGAARKETRPKAFQDFPSCGPDFDRATYDSTLIRYFEDRTGLTATASLAGAASTDDGITPPTAARMARCGVDLLSLDQLLPTDGRLEALVWSWAPGQPTPGGGDCALQGADARWRVASCQATYRVACRRADGSWTVPVPAVTTGSAQEADGVCRDAGAAHAVPRTGYEGQLLRVAQESAGAGEVLLGTRRSGSGWVSADAR